MARRGQGKTSGSKSKMNSSVYSNQASHTIDTYHPVPDGRFYTKANFFTLRNHSRENNTVISEQYQTDCDPEEQEVFEEMMERRKQLGQVQVPAVPGQQLPPANYEAPGSSLFNRNNNFMDGDESSRGTLRNPGQLRPITEAPKGSVFEDINKSR